MAMKDTWLIVWLGTYDSYEYEGTLDEAIAHVKVDRKYQDYGHTGARIYPAVLKYEIKMGPIEWRA